MCMVAVQSLPNLNIIQWNTSNEDTNGAEESILFREVSSFQSGVHLGWEKVSLCEVSSFRVVYTWCGKRCSV